MRRALGTLRWRLTLTYVGLLALLLAALGTYQYVTLQRNLVNVRVESLTGDYDQVRAEIARFLPRTLRNTTTAARVVAALCARMNGATSGSNAAVADPERTFATALTTASGRTATAVVYNRSLQAVASVPTEIADAPRMSDDALRTVIDSRQRSSPQVLDTPDGRQLAVAFPIGAAGGTACGIAQLSTTTQPIDDILSGERARLAIGGGAVLLVALFAGLWLTSRALRPLHRVTETAEKLAAGDLRARSDLRAADEVGTLSRTFDDMAARIEASFAAQAESEARMRRFVADASHELRTPITALKGYIDVMRRGAARDPAALDAALETMGREADRMRLLVLDLLTLARLDAQRPLQSQPLDLAEAVATVLDEGLPGMPAEVVRDLQPVLVMADSNAVATIARNLLGNACKYAPGAAQHWQTAREGGYGVLRVHDDGPGISATDLPHIFERFYRGEKTRAREEGGSGLGLAIVQGLAQAMGGTVSVDSVEGAGTTFTVRLPLAPDRP